MQKTAHLQGMKLQEQNLVNSSWKGGIFLVDTLQPGHEVSELSYLIEKCRNLRQVCFGFWLVEGFLAAK